MVDATLRIKNLSIALETLSHFVGKGPDILREGVAICLRKEIKAYQEEQDEKQQTTRPIPPDLEDHPPF